MAAPAALPATTGLMALGLGCGLALATAWTLTVIPVSRVMPTLGGLLLVLNVGAAVLLFRRAWRAPDERTGWVLLGIGTLGAFVANALTSWLVIEAPQLRWQDWGFLGLHLGVGVLHGAGVLAWPRSREDQGSALHHLLGAALFVVSVGLLMWLVDLWRGAQPMTLPYLLRQVGLAGRVALFGGPLIYLVGVDPRRARGPLGWLLLSAAAASFVIAALRAYALDPSPFRQVSPWLASAVLIPWCFGLAAILGGPVRPEADRRPPRLPLGEVVAYAPYLVSGVVLAVLTLREREALAWPLVAFIAITGILVLRQFLLLREVRRANQGLEVKVTQRTQDLEHLQGVMVRTERMNALATLGAGLAHDLNNLLAAVRGSAELLRMDLEEGKRPSERDVARIQDATGKAGQLTQRLMAFARRESGVGRATAIDPVVALRAQEELLQMLCGSRVVLHVELAHATPGVRVEPGVLEQVLVNLVSNAKDALGGAGQVWVRLHPGVEASGAPTAVLEVEDDGPGIPGHLRTQVFEPFFTTKPEGKGTGLGLASVQALAASQGGRVELVEGRARGACFRVTFAGEA